MYSFCDLGGHSAPNGVEFFEAWRSFWFVAWILYPCQLKQSAWEPIGYQYFMVVEITPLQAQFHLAAYWKGQQ